MTGPSDSPGVTLPWGLVVLRAPAGCGKSTFAAALAAACGDVAAVVATDELRGRLTGDQACADRDAEVFVLRDRLVTERLACGLTVVADSTTLDLRSFEQLRRVADDLAAPVSLVDCGVPRAVAHARNAGRDRVVPPHVVDAQFDRFDAHPRSSFPADVACHREEVVAVTAHRGALPSLLGPSS